MSAGAIPLAPLIGVHGFMYDPADEGHNNPARELYPQWADMAGRQVQGFAYYSIPFGFRAFRPVTSIINSIGAFVGSWGRGYLHPYRRAWSLAEEAGARLARMIVSGEFGPAPVDIICHSLGSRVALTAIADLRNHGLSALVRRVILLNAAEIEDAAIFVAAQTPDIRYLNLSVEGDRVLRYLGSWMGPVDGRCAGRRGLLSRPLAPANWLDIPLDDPGAQRTAALRGWSIAGDEPGCLGDHWYSYRHKGNWPLVRAFLGGDRLTGFRMVG